ncbi:PglL family O-oligosaccharyltransferase [Variovorax paradoxus]|uniref:PglL family O-oligosaccharyltransferase n=1 Tax=Variovorax paradoxus TaxID=34073 RepID=UPI0029C70EE8|nr:Wzy polymerase domain-containing protein [Variovorax paradoxus]
MNSLSKISLAPLWGVIGAALLSLCWLLPNHTQPWTSFHSDAWAASLWAVVACIVLCRAPSNFKWRGLPLFVALITTIPGFQFFSEILPFSGQAWISTAYLLGFLSALWLGEQWNAWRPTHLGNFLFLAVGIGATLSVGLQLQQWLGVARDGTLDVWVASSSVGARPYANMGQANQLATLLLWGLLACGWAQWQRYIRSSIAILLAMLLLFGLALTQSRSGALGVLAVVIATWLWRGLWCEKKKIIPVVAAALAGLYVLFLLLIPLLSQELMFDAPAALIDRANGELRPKLWLLLWDAVLHHPFSGYGWNEVVRAQLLVANSHPALGYPFFQSHNLFFDFLIWTGIPVGASISIVILTWIGTVARRINKPSQLFYFMMILVVGIHALFELPLHYAYFLLPVGVAMGALNGGLRIWELKLPVTLGKFPIVIALGLSVGLLAAAIKDYFEIEETHLSMRLERSGIVNARGPRLPDVWILNQLMETQRFIRFEPYVGASAEKLKWAEDMVALVPSPRGFMKVAILFGINQRPEESKKWLQRMCRVVSREQCAAGPQKWANEKSNYPQLKNIDWPS